MKEPAMFRKVHYRLTLLCSGITLFILLTMSLISLFISENGLKRNHFLSFEKDISSLLTSLEQQKVITHEWLSRLEKNNACTVYLLDNGVPFLFNERNHSDRQQAVLNEALRSYGSVLNDAAFGADSDSGSYQEKHLFTSSQGENYYVCLAMLPGPAGDLRLLVLSSLSPLEAQMVRQRVLFFSLDAVAAAVLVLFSFLFTRRLLLPVEKSRQEQTRFVAAASHELRTPLAVILSCAEACKKASPQEREGFLSTIRLEGRRMSRLVDDLLLLSGADSHSLSLQKEPLAPDTLLLNAYEAFHTLAKEKRICLSIELPETSFSTDGDACCYGDSDRLTQVLSILLHNALSYTPEGGRVTLSLSLEQHTARGAGHLAARKKYPGVCILRVADNGPGIPDEEKQNIFRRFYRMDRSRSKGKHKEDHFGLGLCIASEIMTAMEGSLGVEDTPGGGSTFFVRLPLSSPL